MDKVIVGIDLGGTTVRAGAFDEDGKLLVVRETLIEAPRGPEFGMRKIQGLVEKVLAESGSQSLTGIGIGATGPIDTIRGLINNPFTLPTWANVPVIEWMEKSFSVPVTLENDADAAALGEYWQGAGRDAVRLYAVTVGTGIGTSLVVEGQVYRGLDGSHPEGGHMILDPSGPLCYCKQHGCWESLCAGPAIERQAREANWTASNGDRENVDARMVFDAARAGDRVALAILERVTKYLTQGVLNIAILFAPDTIVLSGGVMRNVDFFMPDLQQTMQSYTEMVPADRIHITPAELGEYAGLYGSAYTIFKKYL